MTKTTTCFAIIMIAGFAMLKLIDIQADAQDSLPGVVAYDKWMQERTVNYFAFKDTFDATLASLHKGEISLADACERVNAVTRRYNPDHFKNLTMSEKGASNEERIARNLVGHIQMTEELAPNPNPRLLQLEIELSNLLREWEAKQ